MTRHARSGLGTTLAVASGKGGTGKTTLATNLALASGVPTRLLDCDVEEPNCHIFLDPVVSDRIPVKVMIPTVDPTTCNKCGLCGRICMYSAIVSFGTVPIVYPDMCHSCYGCLHVCPQGAISTSSRLVGEIEIGTTSTLDYYGGRLRIGESSSPPLIKELKTYSLDSGLTIIDAPPGTSCPVVEAIDGADYVLLVTEPTPFGLNDLELAVAMVRKMDQKAGVVINRAGSGNHLIHDFCREAGIDVLLEIPDDRRIAEAYSRGHTISESLPEYAGLFHGLLADVAKRVAP